MTSNRTNENKNKTKPKTTKKTATGNNVTKRSTAKGRTTGKSRKPEQKPEGIPMSNEITLVVSFGLVVLMMFSFVLFCFFTGFMSSSAWSCLCVMFFATSFGKP